MAPAIRKILADHRDSGALKRMLAGAISEMGAIFAFWAATSANAMTQEPISVRIGTRVFIDTELLSRVETYRCREGLAVISTAFRRMLPRGAVRGRVTEIRIDGRPVPQAELTRLNQVLDSFEPAPAIDLECHSGQYRLSFTQAGRMEPTRVESVPFTP
jgi:hypothetical protein